MLPAADRRRSHRLGLGAGVLIMALATALSSCASSDSTAPPEPAPAPTEPAATVTAGDPITGRGPTEPFPVGAAFPIPDGARSVVVDFECAGGSTFMIELGDSMMLGQAPVSGTCDGTHSLAWPITDRTDPNLHVTIATDVDWVATPTFSTAEFANDSSLTADCEAFTKVYSALMNADIGYTQYEAFDAAEWSSRVDGAAIDLETLAMHPQSPLSEAFTELLAIVTDPGRAVGSVLGTLVTDPAQAPIDKIRQACDANQTPLIVMAEFGG